MNFPARYQFVTDLTKTNISCKTKIFYQNVPFEFSSPTSNKLLAKFWGSTTKKNYFKVNSLSIKTYFLVGGALSMKNNCVHSKLNR